MDQILYNLFDNILMIFLPIIYPFEIIFRSGLILIRKTGLYLCEGHDGGTIAQALGEHQPKISLKNKIIL